MYTITCDGSLLHSPEINSTMVINPVLTLADSEAGKLEFTVPPTHPLYFSIEYLASEIIVYRDGTEIWSGRPIEVTIDFWKQKIVICEGELAYLNDTTQPPAEYHDIPVRTFLETLIAKHNAKVASNHQFTVGVVTIADPNDSLYRYTNWESTLECIYDKLIKRIGGHVRIRKENGTRYIDVLADSPRTSDQIIQFGSNLLDFTQNFDLDDLSTVIVPLGKRLDTHTIAALEDYVTVESVNGGSPYVASSTAVDTYGWIEEVVHWDDVGVPANLLRKAQQYLSDVQFANMILKVSAVDLHNVDVNIDTIEILDSIRVISTPHGLDRFFPVSKRTIPLMEPDKETLTLGTEVKLTLTAETNRNNQDVLDKLNSVSLDEQSILASASANATQLIRSALGGHIYINDDASELLIMDTDDPLTANKVWRWNLNGLGYSNNGYSGNFSLAMTMDGQIVADYVTTGTMAADRIRGGTLTLGGQLNGNGQMIIYDSSGNVIGSWNNDGLVCNVKGEIAGWEIDNYSFTKIVPFAEQNDSYLYEHRTVIKPITVDGTETSYEDLISWVFSVQYRDYGSGAWHGLFYIRADGAAYIRKLLTSIQCAGNLYLENPNETVARADLPCFYKQEGHHRVNFIPEYSAGMLNGMIFGALDRAATVYGLMPAQDNTLKLGYSNLRWTDVYSSNAYIQTSDKNEKYDIEALGDQAKSFIMALKPSSFRVTYGTSNRKHYGLIAQDVKHAMDDLGIDSCDFAGYIAFEKQENREITTKKIDDESGEEITYKSIESSPVFDAEGNPVMGYALRYTEFIAPLIYTVQKQQQEIDSLKAIVKSLVEKVEML